MKQVTLLAIISLCIQIFIQILIMIINYFSFDLGFISEIIGLLNFLSLFGMLPFFITLYKKQ